MADRDITLQRRDVVARILRDRGETLVVTGLGSATWDVAAAGDNPGNFYLWGAMGGAAVTGLGLALAATAQAAGSGMPWEEPLQQVLESVQGPVAKIVAVIIITLTGLTLAFGETSGGMRKLIQIVFGLSIAFAATSFFLTFFSFGGGALV